MRIAILVKTAVGGTWILPHMAEMRRRGHQVDVVLPDGRGRLREALEGLVAEDPGIQIHAIAGGFSVRPGPAALRSFLAVRRCLRSIDPAVVHYHLYASALVARFAALGLGAARVHMIPGPLYLENRWIRRAERWLVRLDSRVICGSEYTRTKYQDLGVPDRKLSVIPYGCDTTKYRPPSPAARRAARADLGLPPEAFVVIMVAYFYPPRSAVFRGVGIKGHETMLEAWAELHRQVPESRLLLVGGGFGPGGVLYREDLQRSWSGRDGGVVWVDEVDDVRDHYAASDLSVCPSLSENHGAAAESTAMGLPCIVSDAGALSELVPPECGWIFPAGEPRLLHEALVAAHEEWHEGRLEDRGARARAHCVTGFDTSAAAVRLVDVLESEAARKAQVRWARMMRRRGPRSLE